MFLFLAVVMSVGIMGCSSNPTAKTSPRQRALLMVQAAEGALLEGDRVGAFNYLKTAEEIDPDCAELYHLRGTAYMSKKDYPKALVEFQKASKLAPKDSAIANTYGKSLLDMGKWDKAEKELLKASDDPTFQDAFKAFTSLGILEEKRGNLKKAQEYYQKAILEDSKLSCIAYQRRARLLTNEGHFQSAQKDLEKATSGLCIKNAEGELALGELFEKRQIFDKAREKYLEIQQEFPDSAQAEEAMLRLKRLTIQ